jgi:hypothetical protein
MNRLSWGVGFGWDQPALAQDPQRRYAPSVLCQSCELSALSSVAWTESLAKRAGLAHLTY